MLRPLLLVGLLLLPAGLASAQQIQEVGTATSFDIATWNIEWFGSTGGGPSNETTQFENVVSVIEQSAIDFWALQEVASTTAFSELVARLGSPWTGELATNSGQQRVGFLYRTDVIQKRRTMHILEQFSSSFAGRPPFQFEGTVLLPDTTFDITVVNVHMKAFSDLSSYERRVEAASRLKSRFDFLEPETNLMLLGDMNDELRESITNGQESPYKRFVDDPTRYRFLTMPLDIANVCTYCGSFTSTIDHILVSDELYSAADAGLTDRLGSVLSGISGFLSNTSDHVPVYARFLPTAGGTAVAEAPVLPEVMVYPVPAHDVLRVDLESVRPHTIELLDMTGRVVRQYTSQRGQTLLQIPVTDLPAGVYGLRLDGRALRIVPVQ